MRSFPKCLTGMSVAVVLTSVPAIAQQQVAASPQARATVLAASFSKFKHLSKEKRGIKREKYIRVQSEPATRSKPVDYSGTYRADFGFGLELRVNPDGSFEGRGYEPLGENVQRTFALRNGKIQGALLTATRVYADGQSEPFEGAFMNRSTYQSPTDKGVTVFGLGVLGKAVTVSGMTIDKFFFEKTM